MSSAPVEVVWASAQVWDDVEQLFGPAGASNGCWCQYWILGADYTRREGSQTSATSRSKSVRTRRLGRLPRPHGAVGLAASRLVLNSIGCWIASRNRLSPAGRRRQLVELDDDAVGVTSPKPNPLRRASTRGEASFRTTLEPQRTSGGGHQWLMSRGLTAQYWDGPRFGRVVFGAIRVRFPELAFGRPRGWSRRVPERFRHSR